MTADVGAAAPQFDLESDTGTRVKLRDFQGEWLVLYFYPRDSTPGCTREAQDFTLAAPRLRTLGARVAGVSRDSVKSHGSFRDKFKIGFPLLSDPDLSAHKSYAAWGKKVMYGKEIEGALRSTFLIAPDGRVAQVWRSVRVDGHVDAVLAALKAAATTEAKGPREKLAVAVAKKTRTTAKAPAGAAASASTKTRARKAKRSEIEPPAETKAPTSTRRT